MLYFEISNVKAWSSYKIKAFSFVQTVLCCVCGAFIDDGHILICCVLKQKVCKLLTAAVLDDMFVPP